MKAVVASSLCLVVGCVEPPDLGTESQFGAFSGGGGINETQGRAALGQNADPLVPPPTRWNSGTLATKGATSTQFSLLASDHSCLTATIGGLARQCADAAFNGYVFSAGGLSYTIVSSAAVPSSTTTGGSRTGYRLQTAAGVDYCVGGHLAHPVAARIDVSGISVSTWSPPSPPTAFTWACTGFLPSGTKDPVLVGNGVLAKAIDWGFRTEQVLHSMTGIPAAPIPGLELAAVATRMGRADYCHDGVTHTLEGAAISYLDLVDGNDVPNATGPVESSPTAQVALGVAVPVPTDTYYLEAVWTRPSTLAGGNTDSARPLCLSKLRWQSLPVGTRCGTTLRDPRVDADAKFCEDWTYEALASAGGVIVNASKRNDVGLWRWRHDSNDDHYTTTVGANNGTKPTTPPAPGYTTATVPLFLGTLLTGPGKLVFEANYTAPSRGVMAEVVSCKKTGGTDWITTAPSVFALPAGYSDCKSEGWMWTTAPSPAIASELGWDLVPLHVWKKGNEYLTTVATSVVGYTNVATLGWIARPLAW